MDMRSLTRRLAPVALALLIVSGLVPAALAAETGALSESAIVAAEGDALTLTNNRRAAAGLRALRFDARLADLARERAEYMARTGTFSHTQSGGTDVFDLIRAKDIAWYGAGEIIAWNTAASLDYSAAFAVQGWMNSPSHKSIVMSTGYNYVGFGLAIASSGKRYWAGVYLKGPDRTGAYAKITSVTKAPLSATRSKVTLRWGGSDIRMQVLTSGFRYFEIARRYDGGAWVSYGTTTATSVVREWTKGHTWEFRVRARDKAGNWGSWRSVTVNP
jgi:uncharacterized protein YkwD